MLYELNDYLNHLYVRHEIMMHYWIEAICDMDYDEEKTMDSELWRIVREIEKVRKDMGV